MIAPRTKFAIQCLHWTVGIVVLIESVQTFYAAHSLHGPGHVGTLIVIRLVLSACETVAALLFLLPASSVVGGLALLVIFGLAITIHAFHGDFRGLEILVLYGVAVCVSLADRWEGRTAQLRNQSNRSEPQ